MKNILVGWIIFIGILLSSCDKDLGNYTYDESVEDVKVIVDKSFSIMKEKRDFTITPKFEMQGDKSALSFLWLMNTSSDQTRGDTVSTSETLTIHLDPSSPNFQYKYYIRFYVTDNRIGATALYPMQLTIGKPYQTSWMVLHTVDNHAEIGAVEYVGDNIITEINAFTNENEKSLAGMPVVLGYHPAAILDATYWGYAAEAELYIATTVPEESGLLNQSNHLELVRNWTKLIHPDQIADFNSTDIQMRGTCDVGAIMISNGKVFRNSRSPIFAKGGVAEGFEGDYYLSKVYVGPHVGLGYDKIGHRFVHLQMQSKSWSNTSFYSEPNDADGTIMRVVNSPLSAANPNDIGADKDVIRILGGYQYNKSYVAWQRYAFYAYALSNTSSKSHIYVFHAYAMTSTNDEMDLAPLSALYTINTPKGITEDTPMAASPSFNNILFYAVDNKVYKLDFGQVGGVSTMIYQHPDPSAKIVDLKMAVEGYTRHYSDDSAYAEDYGHPFTRSLGVAVNLPGGDKEKGEVVILNLNTAGKVDADGKFPSVQRFEGFGSITNIGFI